MKLRISFYSALLFRFIWRWFLCEMHSILSVLSILLIAAWEQSVTSKLFKVGDSWFLTCFHPAWIRGLRLQISNVPTRCLFSRIAAALWLQCQESNIKIYQKIQLLKLFDVMTTSISNDLTHLYWNRRESLSMHVQNYWQLISLLDRIRSISAPSMIRVKNKL